MRRLKFQFNPKVFSGVEVSFRFGEEAHMGVVVKCPHTFGHIMYFNLISHDLDLTTHYFQYYIILDI